jgi:hypothetical protein
MRFAFWKVCSGDCPHPRGVRLSARFRSGKIGLSPVKLTEAEIAIGALWSLGYRLAIHLCARCAQKTRQRYCNSN